VSVVIPCYNQAHFLTQAIESVLQQTCRSFEIVVVDDGSTDNTGDVAARYSEVRCVRQENRGLAAARNAGLRASQAPCLVFLDADDRLLPDALKIGVESLAAHPSCAFVYGRLTQIAPDGSRLSLPVQRQVENDHCVELLREDFIWTSGVVMYRRSAVDMVDGFDSRIDACADCDLNIRITRDHPVYGHGQVVLEYRHHDASMSRNAALMLKTAMTALGYQLKYVAGHRRLEEACRAGKKTTKEYFGRRLVKELNGQLHSREWRRMMAGCLTLVAGWMRAPVR